MTIMIFFIVRATSKKEVFVCGRLRSKIFLSIFHDAMTFSIMTFSLTTFNKAMKCVKVSITILSVMGLTASSVMTLSVAFLMLF